MAGIFPASGVTADRTNNAVDADTTCTDELFYSATICKPRFDASAMNALISEILNVINGSGEVYDCNSLTNLFDAIRSMTGIPKASSGLVVAPGGLVECTETVNGEQIQSVLWNPTASNITVQNFTDCFSLVGLGFQRINTRAQVYTATTAGWVDDFGNTAQIGDVFVTFADGQTLNLSAGGDCAVACLAVNGLTVPNRGTVQSSDGDLFYNCTGADVTLGAGSVSTVALTSAGFCQFEFADGGGPVASPCATACQASQGVVVPQNGLVASGNGTLWHNCTGGDVTIGALIGDGGMEALGFCRLTNPDTTTTPTTDGLLAATATSDTGNGANTASVPIGPLTVDIYVQGIADGIVSIAGVAGTGGIASFQSSRNCGIGFLPAGQTCTVSASIAPGGSDIVLKVTAWPA